MTSKDQPGGVPTSNGSAIQDKPNNLHLNARFIPAIVIPAVFLLACASLATYLCMFRSSASSREEDKLQEKEIQAIATALPNRFSYRALEIAECDVYSYGMVLLEIVGGRRNICLSKFHESGEDLNWHLPSWAAERFSQGKILELVDKRLEGAFDTEQVTRMVLVALCCIQDDPKGRPEMAQVMKMLEGSMEITGPPPRSIGHAPSPS